MRKFVKYSKVNAGTQINSNVEKDIKCYIFDYLCELGEDLDGYPISDISSMMIRLNRDHGVDYIDVENTMDEYGCELVEALQILSRELSD